MNKPTHPGLEEGAGLGRKRIHLREISDEADAPLETVGQDLRAARLRSGQDLATIARALKIRKDHLESLEEDRQSDLPGRAYAIGFVRSYADFLGLNPGETVERFKREIGAEERSGSPLFEAPPDERRLPQGWIIIALVLIAALAFGFWQLARSAGAYFNPVPPPATTRSASPPISARSLKPLATRPPATRSRAMSSGQAVPKAPPGPAAPPPAAPRAAASTATPAHAALAAQIKALPPGNTYGDHNKNARVVLTALKPVHVLVQGPAPRSMTYINRVLQPGDRYRVPNLVGATLTTQDPGALAIELDGQLVGRAGTDGTMVEAQSLDPQVLVDRFNHGPQH